MKKDKRKSKGFTLIELLAVIVILGVLMLVAIPAVSRYIEKSKKEAFIKEINSLVDTVRYGITTNDNNYSMIGQNRRTFSLKSIETEKVKIPIEGILTVSKISNKYSYYVKVTKNKNNYCLTNTDIDVLTEDDIMACNDLEKTQYHISKGEYENKKISYKGSNWYVIEDSAYADDYVTLMKENVLTNDELGTYAYSTIDPNWANISTYSKANSNIFNNSDMKKTLESYMETSNMTNDLIEVNNYKIRLITIEELQKNFGYRYSNNSNLYFSDSITPSWINKRVNNNIDRYWTMTSYADNDYEVWTVEVSSDISSNSAVYTAHTNSNYARGVRPVINLKKSVIENS